MDILVEPAVPQAGLGDASCPGEEAMCGEHNQLLSLFCLDDLSPVCWECEESASHEGHRVYPIQDALQDCKGELGNSVQKMQESAWEYDIINQFCQSTAQYNLSKAENTERQIKMEFQKLHQFLREEEEARIAALKEEEEQKKEKIKEQADKFEDMIELLSKTISEIEKEIETPKVSLFRENFQGTITRIWQCKGMPGKIPNSLIDEPQHVANLRFKVWKKMQSIAPCIPVSLDPSTASPLLTVSGGLNQVQRAGADQTRPAFVPQPFNGYTSVVGTESVSSGTRSWDVEVGDCSGWTLGVAELSDEPREELEACPEEGLWTIGLRDGRYMAMASPCESLRGVTNEGGLRRVRVSVDWDGGLVSFTDPDSDTHLYTFSHTFTEPLIPYFESICKIRPLVILPKEVSVVVEEPKIPEDEPTIDIGSTLDD